jgi:hypothetical protein
VGLPRWVHLEQHHVTLCKSNSGFLVFITMNTTSVITPTITTIMNVTEYTTTTCGEGECGNLVILLEWPDAMEEKIKIFIKTQQCLGIPRALHAMEEKIKIFIRTQECRYQCMEVNLNKVLAMVTRPERGQCLEELWCLHEEATMSGA